MNTGQFTPQAELLWKEIPLPTRERILANVYCVKCRKAVSIRNFKGEERNGDIVLTGNCELCGYEVVRVVETSEIDRSNN